MTSGIGNRKFVNRFLSDALSVFGGVEAAHGDLIKNSAVTTTRFVDKKKFVGLSLLAGVLLASDTIEAKATLEKPKAFQKKLQEAADPLGPFAKGEAFPKSYFLIPFNLPYLVGLALYHPKSSTLGLNDEQIRRIEEVRKSTVPSVLKKASEIKSMEIALAREIGMQYHSQTPERYFERLEEIARAKLELSKDHLRCIDKVKSILTQDQYQKLLKYATSKNKKQGEK